MIRLFGSDVLHTWTLGFIEACVGFTLQIVKYIGHKNVDSGCSSSVKKLIDVIKEFPGHNSLQPVRHIMFSDIYCLFQSSSSKKLVNPKNTTSILKMRESYKLASALLQIFFALAHKDILPNNVSWSKDHGFAEPYFCPAHVVINALNAVLEIHWYIKAGSLTESQLCTMEMLVANAQAHMLILDIVRKRIIEKATVPEKEFVDLNVQTVTLMSYAKFELISHIPEAMRQSGCDNNVRDTEMGELSMKLCKVLFSDTSQKYFTVVKEMLLKYLHLEYMAIANKGLDEETVHMQGQCIDGSQQTKSHMHNTLLCEHENKRFKTNSNYNQQTVKWDENYQQYRPKRMEEDWKVHPMLKVGVRVSYCIRTIRSLLL